METRSHANGVLESGEAETSSSDTRHRGDSLMTARPGGRGSIPSPGPSQEDPPVHARVSVSKCSISLE